ncbi:MAG: 16S rRNA (cytidine(1402)-2'-O)-methyltransferase [Chitinophagaceae bacterium]
MCQGKLYIVPTPIGNLGDITLRALDTLKQVDIILAEDTRHSGTLLKHYDITTKILPFHAHNEHQKVSHFIDFLKKGKHLAMITDAGTPGISDPAYLLINHCVQNNISVNCLPGATAFVPALVASGFPIDRFFFEGFLPTKKGRRTRLQFLAQQDNVIILYEAPHRLKKLLVELLAYFEAEREICICKEISKLHEKHIRSSLKNLQELHENQCKGEFVLIINKPSKISTNYSESNKSYL